MVAGPPGSTTNQLQLKAWFCTLLCVFTSSSHPPKLPRAGSDGFREFCAWSAPFLCPQREPWAGEWPWGPRGAKWGPGYHPTHPCRHPPMMFWPDPQMPESLFSARIRPDGRFLGSPKQHSASCRPIYPGGWTTTPQRPGGCQKPADGSTGKRRPENSRWATFAQLVTWRRTSTSGRRPGGIIHPPRVWDRRGPHGVAVGHQNARPGWWSAPEPRIHRCGRMAICAPTREM